MTNRAQNGVFRVFSDFSALCCPALRLLPALSLRICWPRYAAQTIPTNFLSILSKFFTVQHRTFSCSAAPQEHCFVKSSLPDHSPSKQGIDPMCMLCERVVETLVSLGECSCQSWSLSYRDPPQGSSFFPHSNQRNQARSRGRTEKSVERKTTMFLLISS